MEVLTRNLTREEFAELLGKVEVVVVPVGSHEQHGPHLPLEHDGATVEYIAEEAARRVYPKALVAPLVSVGLSPHHMRWPGTITLKTETFVNVIVEICESLGKHGVKRFLILNGHAGNYSSEFSEDRRTAPVDLAVLKVRGLGLNVTGASYWDLFPPSLYQEVLSFDRDAGHAGEFETSETLYISPSKVRVQRLGSAEATSGHTDAATVEKGRRIVEESVKGTVACIDAFIAGRIDEVHYRPYASK